MRYNKDENNKKKETKKIKLFTFVLENTWLRKDLPESKSGSSLYDVDWGNGYVIVPKKHPIYGLDYESIKVDINGGLTFASSVKELIEQDWAGFKDITIPKRLQNGWVVGFDTAHYGDTLEKWSKEAVEAETERLKQQLINYKK